MTWLASTSGGEICDWCHNVPADAKPLRPVPGERVGRGPTSRELMVCSSCTPKVCNQLAIAGTR